jgi:hypothetical protein
MPMCIAALQHGVYRRHPTPGINHGSNRGRRPEAHYNEVEMIMSETATALQAHRLTGAQPRRPGFLRRVLAAVIASREAEAQGRVDGYLATLSDDRLRELGYDPAVVRARGGRGAPISVWS